MYGVEFFGDFILYLNLKSAIFYDKTNIKLANNRNSASKIIVIRMT